MSKRVLILVEGQTEERFVKDVLAPAFFEKELFFAPTLLVTKRVKDGPNFKGGVTNFAKFENDLRRLFDSASGALVTTLLDYYRLPNDFPGMASRTVCASARDRVVHVELAIRRHFDCANNFLPFLMLHEFEAWLFADTSVLPRVLTDDRPKAEFSAMRAAVATPEEINARPDWAPSKRIERLFPTYRKTAHGPTAAKRIGIDRIRSECPHFNEWLTALDRFAES